MANIIYLKHEEIDFKRWDDTVLRSFNGIVYAYSWYLDVICSNWEALVEENYKFIFPLTHGRKFGIDYLYQPFFTQQLGIFSIEKLSPSIVLEMLNTIPQKYRFIDIKLNTFNKVESDEFVKITNHTYELDLISDYATLSNNFSSNAKRNIKKAINSKVQIIQNADPQQIIDIFRNNRGRFVKVFKTKQYLLLNNIIKKAIAFDKLEVWGAKDENNHLCAGIFFLRSGNKVILLFSGSNHVARKNGAMSFLLDRFINLNCLQDLTLDFNGSNDTNQARFYAGFGAKECHYLRIRKNLLPWYLRIVKSYK